MSENFLVKKFKEKKVELLENNSILVNINDWKEISQFIFKSKFDYLMCITLRFPLIIKLAWHIIFSQLQKRVFRSEIRI